MTSEPEVRSRSNRDLWAHRNLFAWGLTVDSKSRTVEEQAQMLGRLGIKHVAHSWQGQSLSRLERDLETFERHHISVLACAITDANTPAELVDWTSRENQVLGVEEGTQKPADDVVTVGEMLEAFKRYKIAPQLWLIRNMRERTPASYPTAPFEEWTDEQKNQAFHAYLGYDTTAPGQKKARIELEARRLAALARLADSYSLKVGLYKHGGWIGITENQVGIVSHLRTRGVNNVGIVYQFVHARDEVDETQDFHAVWAALQPYVLAVNITGLHGGRRQIFPILYPSQGEVEVGMMRIIQDSGWQGPIGVSSEKGGDAEVNLRNNVIGLNWIAAELERPGSGGSPPFG